MDLGRLCVSCESPTNPCSICSSHHQIEVWVVAPFKKPESDDPENTIFNNQVSIIRIRSEHAIGFLKGRFQSLKSLHINIKDDLSHKFATYWVVACIGVHNFALKVEAEEKDDSDSDYQDPFVAEGLTDSSDDENTILRDTVPRTQRARATTLAAGKRRRNQLKSRLFKARERQAERRHQQDETSASEDGMDE